MFLASGFSFNELRRASSVTQPMRMKRAAAAHRVKPDATDANPWALLRALRRKPGLAIFLSDVLQLLRPILTSMSATLIWLCGSVLIQPGGIRSPFTYGFTWSMPLFVGSLCLCGLLSPTVRYRGLKFEDLGANFKSCQEHQATSLRNCVTSCNLNKDNDVMLVLARSALPWGAREGVLINRCKCLPIRCMKNG